MDHPVEEAVFAQRLGAWLRTTRATLGLKQREAAWRAGLGISRLCLIEQGRVVIRLSEGAALATALGAPLVELCRAGLGESR